MSWFKPMKPMKMEFAPFDDFGNSKVDDILKAHYLPNTQHSILSLVSQRQQQNEVLGLTLKLPVGYNASSEADFEQLHNELLNELEKVGICELNLHLLTQKSHGASQQQQQPEPRKNEVPLRSVRPQANIAADEDKDVGTHSQWQGDHAQLQYQGTQGQWQGGQSQYQGKLPQVTDAQADSQSTKREAIQQANESSKVGVANSQTNARSQTDPEARSDAVQHEDALTNRRPAPPTQNQLQPHPRIKNVIVVASGKGGVGKSTTTVNLALALQQTGAKVGVLDADIYGPSIPTMLGTAGKTPVIDNEQFVPLEAYGMAVLSIGNLIGDDTTPIVWRGPKATGALMQLFNQTAWPDLDYLLIDMPPGTGDIQLTLAQRIPVTGAVIVTTPQHIALLDAQKGIEMFNKVNIPVLGVVENMSTHVCSNCGHEDEIFGAGGGDQLSTAYQVPLLGRLPLSASIRKNSDAGQPSVAAKDTAAGHYKDIALAMLVQLAKIPQRQRDNNRIF